MRGVSRTARFTARAAVGLACIAGAVEARAEDPVRVIADVPYAGDDDPRHRLDLYLPAKPSAAELPLIIAIHGGAFRVGDKAMESETLRSLVASGAYIGAALNYRLTDRAKWPAQIHDCKGAVRWLRANAAKYGVDPSRVGVVGSSAGGHLAAMLGTSGGVGELEGDIGGNAGVNSRVTCVVDQFGPVDFATLYGDNEPADAPEAALIGGAIKSNLALARAASPTEYVDAKDPPFLIIHGTADPLIDIGQSQRFAGMLERADVPVTFIKVTGGGHGRFANPEVANRVRTFFDRHLRGQDVKVSAEDIANAAADHR